jgi:uncharacterized iron-regulated membrane protein
MKPATIKAWGAVHTWTSLVCTLFMVIACVTGLAMIWIDEIDAGFAGHPAPPETVGAAAATPDLDRMFADAERRTPGEKVTYADWAFDGKLVGVNLAEPGNPKARRQIVYDAASGAYLEDLKRDPNARHPVRTFLGIMNRLHIELMAGQTGEYVLAFMGALFVAATVSGMVLYAPFMWKLEFGEIRRERSARARWLDIHNLVGVATVGWVVVVGVTGVMNAFTVPAYAAWRKQTVPTLVAPYRGAAPEEAGVGAMQAVEAAHRALPGGRMVRITPPGGKVGSPRHYVVWTQGASPVTSKLFRPILVEAQTGEVVLSAPPPWWLSALQLSRPLHFGNYGGPPLKVLWSLLDLAAIAILGSGIYLWIARRRRGAA